MSIAEKNFPARAFSTPPPTWKKQRWSPAMTASERKRRSPQPNTDLFHVIHKVPAGDSPYVRAKHAQLINKDPSKAISLFWAAINSGDRVDSALKDMAVVMKQLNRSDEAVEAVKSFRQLCPPESQESLDNILIELYKRSSRMDEQIELLQLKLKQIEEGLTFGGRRTKIARSQGKKIQISIEQEYSRLLGNLAWAFLQQNNYKSAEEHYRKALSLEPDKNKQCNLAICLMHMNKITEAKFLIQTIKASSDNGEMDESYAKSFERAIQILDEIESQSVGEGGRVKERQVPFSSVNNWTSKEFSVSSNAEGKNEYGFGISKRLEAKQNDQTRLLDENNRACAWSHCETNKIFSNNKLKNRSYTDSQHGRRTNYVGIRNENWWFGSKTAGSGFACKNAYASPVPAEGIPKVPFTQPRRYSCFPDGCRDQRMALQGEGAFSSCNRKLSFEQPNIGKSERIVDYVGGARGQASSHGDSEYSYITVEKSPEMSGTVEASSENMNCNPNYQSQISSSGKSKKLWADMVDEDDEALLSVSTDFLKEKGSLFPFQTPKMSCSNGWNGEGEYEYNDENSNSNVIIPGTPPIPPNQIDQLNQKFMSFNMRDGYHTQPGNKTAYRSLCFDHQRQMKHEGAENNCSSPLPNKVLDLEGQNCEQERQEEEAFSSNGIKLGRGRSRLQVFRDITLLSESPRP